MAAHLHLIPIGDPWQGWHVEGEELNPLGFMEKRNDTIALFELLLVIV